MENLPFTYADAAIVLVLAVSAVLAFMRGFVREMLHILAWIGATLVAVYGFSLLQPVMKKYLQPDLLANLVAAGGLFVLSLIVLIFVAASIAKKVKESDIGAVDRSLGFIFGLARGLLILALAYLVLVQFLPPKRKDQPEWVTASRGLPYVRAGATYLTKLAPELFESALKTIDEAGDAAGTMIKKGSVKATEQPAAEAEPDKQTGYPEAPRQQMDRLIESQQKR
jgi:membrane protein required for colicin V production